MKAINKKNNDKYLILNDNVINCTNKDSGTRMVLYTKGKDVFVREYDEFLEKFKILKNG